MSGVFLEFGLLLVCSIFQYSEGAGKDQCPDPDTAKFAEYYTDQYVVGTSARYICDEGYKRQAGKSNIIKCTNISGIAQWKSTHQPICLGPSPTEKWEKSSSGPQLSTSTPTVMEGYCGVPAPYKHATVKVIKYKVGQKLSYKCLNESQAQAPITGIIRCEESSGVALWTGLNPPCTNDEAVPPSQSQKQYLDPAPLFVMIAVTMVFVL
ncbi:uncharacterized protein LOC120320099 [Crotalus tigris]|uniref:uncharacterized protein LOC120320099 n=1 Tax=Crotalus tigris TaxID=88082 RepID=UPI00192F98A6|nr:uncharacterized protein LOC120320099 [Crotalus tigris]